MIRDELTNEALTRAIRVDVGRVDEVAAGSTESVVDLADFFFGAAPTPILAKGHGTEAEIRHLKTAASEKSVIQANSIIHGGVLGSRSNLRPT
jgi:hypothetical protein